MHIFSRYMPIEKNELAYSKKQLTFNLKSLPPCQDRRFRKDTDEQIA
jgi:hypothetical protein